MRYIATLLLLLSASVQSEINFPVDANYPANAKWYQIYAPGGICTGECIVSQKLSSQQAFGEGYPNGYPIGRDPDYDFLYIVPVALPQEDQDFYSMDNSPVYDIPNNTYTDVYTPTRVPVEQVERLVDAAESSRHALIDDRVIVDGVLRLFVCTGALLDKTLNNETPPPAVVNQCRKLIVQSKRVWRNRLHAIQLKAQAATIVPDDLQTFPEPEPLQ